MMENNRWKPNKLGLFNFWYHGHTVIDFANGKGFIRGKNGSGKSVTTSMYVPVLLDGNTSPSRLDPFGSRDRKMVDMLLGEEKISERENGTGYMYLEFKKENTEQYITIGMGLHGKRKDRKVDIWYFIIQDNRRIAESGEGFSLSTESRINGKLETFPLSKKELREKIGLGGKLVESRNEYMELVNKHIFQFDTTENYKDLIKLLINLRSPKLSKDFKPTVVSEILSKSLPELSDSELAPLSETIQIIEQHEEMLEKRKREASGLKKLVTGYGKYNDFVLLEKSKNVENAKTVKNKSEKAFKETKSELNNLETELVRLNKLLKDLETEEIVLNEELSSLDKHDLIRLEEEKQKLTHVLKNEKQKETAKEAEQDEKNKHISRSKRQIAKLEQAFIEIENSIKDTVLDLDGAADEMYFEDHEELLKHFMKNKESKNYDFGLWKNELATFENRIKNLEKDVAEHEFSKREEKTVLTQLNNLKQKLDDAEINLKELRAKFEKEQEILSEKISNWLEQNAYFEFTENEKNMCFQQLLQYDEIPFEFRNLLDEKHENIKNSLQMELFSIEKEKKDLRISIDEINKEIDVLSNNYEPMPFTQNFEEVSYDKLNEAGINFLKFYQTIEFKDEVDMETRRKIEGAITKTGLLTSVIVKKEDFDEASKMASVVSYGSRKEKSLLDYMYPLNSLVVPNGSVQEILAGISVSEKDGGYILDSGVFKSSFTEGYAYQDTFCYIGEKSKEATIKEMIETLKDKKVFQEQILIGLEEESLKISSSLTGVEEEKKNFPSTDNLDEILLKESNEKRYLDDILRKDYEKTESEYKIIGKAIENQKEKIKSLVKGLHFEPTIDTVHSILENIGLYRESLNELDKTVFELRQKKVESSREEDILNQYEDDLLRITGEQNVISDEVSKLSRKIESIEEQLKLPGNEEAKERIRSTKSRLLEVARELKDTLPKIGNTESGIQQKRNLLEEQRDQVEYDVYTLSLLEGMLNDELMLGLTSFGADVTSKEIVRSLSSAFADKTRNELEADVSSLFSSIQYDLIDYVLNKKYSVTSDTELNLEFDYEKNEQLRKLVDNNKRSFITLIWDQSERTPEYVLNKLEETINSLLENITEEEKGLYQKVLIDDIGQTIKERIYQARRWEKQINQTLKEKKTSLQLRVKWRSKGAQEGEMSGDEILELLEQDSKWVDPEKLEQINSHFKTRIDLARQQAKTDDKFNLHTSIKQILDYRSWYQFVIYYKLGDLPEKELTDTRFGAFSGGEKAMSMYIPLFSALSAKYAEANENSPRILALDEAFAGVDDDNIEELFGILNVFDFDFVMNSQTLWGCYSTVNELSIVEIIRPVDSPDLTTINYQWDGTKKHLITESEVEGELVE